MASSRCVIAVEGLDCPVEANALRGALEGTRGVLGLDFDLIHGTMAIRFDPGAATTGELLRRAVVKTGMKAHLVDLAEPRPAPPSRWRAWAPTIASGLGLGAGTILGALDRPRSASLAYLLAVAAGGVDLLPHAARSVRAFRLDIHVLMSLAVVGALALGQFDEAATVAFLFGLSEALESLSVGRARSAIQRLLEVEPASADRVEPDGSSRSVPARDLAPGDRVRVRQGASIPIDGTVRAGRTSVDQKAITGESVPIPRGEGDPVFAGTINGEGAIEVEATAALGDALISRIIDRVRAAQADRPPIERSIGRFASVYTPVVVLGSLLAILAPPLVRLAVGWPASWSTSLERGLVILVVACPCALVIATPVAVASALAAAARRGILIKGGSYLEEFGRLRVLAFDKTGTLTRGEPEVVEIVAADGGSDADLLRIAAALGEPGTHVLGRAIARHARSLRLEIPRAEDYEAVPGLGASARLDSAQYHIGSHRYLDDAGACPADYHDRLNRAEAASGTAVALLGPTGPLGWIHLADRPRPEAAAVLADLRALGVDPLMLTGDNAAAAATVGLALGIVDRRAGLLPGDKATLIQSIEAERGPTGMVGDGVNDAPALAAARVSVALGGLASPAAVETADIVLMADDLRALPYLIRLSRSTLALIRQNITLALSTKFVVALLALAGFASLGLAILADVGTTLLVTANALRLLRGPSARPGRISNLPKE